MVQYDTHFSLLIGHSAYCDKTHAAANACNQVHSRNLKSLVSLPRTHPASTVCSMYCQRRNVGWGLETRLFIQYSMWTRILLGADWSFGASYNREADQGGCTWMPRSIKYYQHKRWKTLLWRRPYSRCQTTERAILVQYFLSKSQTVHGTQWYLEITEQVRDYSSFLQSGQ